MSNLPRVKLYQGTPRDFSSMPTCAVCHVQIGTNEEYAGVATKGSIREARHNVTACLRYEYGPADVLVPGAVVHTHRYTIAEWCGRVPGVITERTERFNEYGWRAYVIEPDGTIDTDAIVAELRSHREEFFRRLADTVTFDLEPQEVFISDKEWTHYVLPS